MIESLVGQLAWPIVVVLFVGIALDEATDFHTLMYSECLDIKHFEVAANNHVSSVRERFFTTWETHGVFVTENGCHNESHL